MRNKVIKNFLKRFVALVLVFCMTQTVYAAEKSLDAQIINAAAMGFTDWIGILNKDGWRTDFNYKESASEILDDQVKDFIIRFGRYPQTGISDMAKQPIEWIMLQKDPESGTALLVSKYVLDERKMFDIVYSDLKNMGMDEDETKKFFTYENSDLRKWLNNEFFNTAFNATEKSYIQTYSKTKDKVWIMDEKELKAYFRTDLQNFRWDRETIGFDKYKYKHVGNPFPYAEPTTYAENNWEEISNDNDGFAGDSLYGIWLRDTDKISYYGKNKNIFVVRFKGHETGPYEGDSYSKIGSEPAIACCAVRPCIWVKYDNSAAINSSEIIGKAINWGIGSMFDSILPGASMLLP